MIRSKNMVLVNISFLVLSILVSNINMAEVLNTAVSAANNDFTKDVYYNLAGNSQNNAVMSPFSLHLVLGMASFGAQSQTADAMMKGLRIKHSETLLKDYKGIIEQLNKSPELKIANKIYAAADVELNPTYQKQTEEYFKSELEKADFSKSDVAAKQMNDWVADKTNQKIKDLIKGDSLSADTQLVLINAIHFKGKWSIPFKVERTKEEPFYLNDKDSVNVPMMHMKDHFYLYQQSGDDGFKMLELPYGKKDEQHFSMHIFLPNKRTGLADLEKKLFQNKDSFAETFGNIVKNTSNVEVEVTLPRFKIESEWEMTDLCKKLGMDVIFSNQADFSLMTKNKTPLKVSKVIQKAFIEVNEEGTEAAAATGVQFVKYSLSFIEPKQLEYFVADHPFLFVIRSKTDESILFLGPVHTMK